MQKNRTILITIIAITSLFAPLTASILEFMSYNIRRMGNDPVEHQWANRKQLILDQILSKKPAIIGFQEVVIGKQLEDLKKGLPNYIALGDIGRKAFTTGWYQTQVCKLERATNESNPIFYDPTQVNLIADGTFGINPIGRFFTASLPRVCTWAGFADKENGKKFIVYNTHLSSSGAWGLKDGNDLIREKQVAMIIKNIKKRKAPRSVPIILMGDFNTKYEGPIKAILNEAGFGHARKRASIKKGPEETRTGWNDEELKMIDHIFVRGHTKVLEYEVVEASKGNYPSDHRPVCTKIDIE